MTKYLIEYNRKSCIGAKSCVAACPKFWKMAKDDKADLDNSEKNNDNSMQTREINEDELKCNLEAAYSCPVNAIHIKKESGEKLIYTQRHKFLDKI